MWSQSDASVLTRLTMYEKITFVRMSAGDLELTEDAVQRVLKKEIMNYKGDESSTIIWDV